MTMQRLKTKKINARWKIIKNKLKEITGEKDACGKWRNEKWVNVLRNIDI